MFPMKNLKREEKQSTSDWLSGRRGMLLDLLACTGMSSDAVLAVLFGLKTEAQVLEMGAGMIDYYDKTGKMPNHNQVMTAMVSIRQTGVYSHGEFDEEEETR